jgi:general secretion pathway protein I
MTRARSIARGFTLLEVMIAIAFIGIAMLALLALHRQNLQAVIRTQNLTRAAMLAQGLMSEAETEGAPPLGTTQGDFSKIYSGSDFRNFRWKRTVDQSPFANIRRVHVSVLYGPRFGDNFDLMEFIHLVSTPQVTPATGTVATGGGEQVGPWSRLK